MAGSSTKAVVVLEGEKLTISAETTTTGVLVGTACGGTVAICTGIPVDTGVGVANGVDVLVGNGTGVNVGVGVIVGAGPVV
jgi:hypothetical protein